MKLIFLLFNFLFATNTSLLSINNTHFTLQDFYSVNPKVQWVRSDSLKQNKLYNDFINRQLVILEAKQLGFLNDPELYSTLQIKSDQLLVNETYEKLVAEPLIDNNVINEAKKHAKREFFLHHILIGHNASYLASPPSRSIDDAFLLTQQILNKLNEGLDFAALAIEYSDDPSVNNNQGSLGWVEWGLTAAEFQFAAFKLKKGEVSSPVLTSFGYHIIFAENIRFSDYNKMSDNEFNNYIINLSKRTVRNKLRAAATSFDSSALAQNNVIYDSTSLNKIVNTYNNFKTNNNTSLNKNIDLKQVVESLIKKDVIFVRNGLGFGPMWLINKIKNVPLTRHPSLSSIEAVTTVLNNFILQDIAIENGIKYNIDSTFSFKKRIREIEGSLLYDAYLKFIQSAPFPVDSLEIATYYNNNKEKKYLSRDTFIIDELRFRSRAVADSVKLIISINDDFLKYENGRLKIVYNNNLSITKSSHPSLYSAASLLEKNKMSDVLASFGGNFSLFKINKNIPPYPLDLSKVYSKIDVVLKKEKQNQAKNIIFNQLKNKYKISTNLNLLP